MTEKSFRIQQNASDESGKRVEAILQLDGQKHKVYFQSDSLPISLCTESIAAFSLFPCMKKGVDIYIQGEASPKFIVGLDKIQDVILSWKPNYHRIQVRGVTPAVPRSSGGTGVGLFFSGGLDSFYTLLKNVDVITDLILVHGFDIPPNDFRSFEHTARMVRSVAQHYGKRAIIIRTNARQFLDRYAFFGFTNGALMASIGHLLSCSFNRFYFSAPRPALELIPDGVHPGIDPNWGTEYLEFVHEGLEATRADKATLIATSDIALHSLRVCLYKPREEVFNCGRCEKCLRTMVDLRVAGVIDRCTTFESELDLNRLYRKYFFIVRKRRHLEWSLEALRERGDDPELDATLNAILNLPKFGEKLRKRFQKVRQTILGRKTARRDAYYRRKR